MKKLLTIMLALCIALSLTACSSEESSDSGSTGEYKDTFTYAINGEPDYLDPAIIGSFVGAQILYQVYFPLFYIGEDGTIENGAVTSYDVDDSGTVYTFYLTEDNYWSDGEAVTAHDYVYGMLRSLGYGVSDSYYSYFIRDYVLNAYKYGADGATSYISEMTDVGIVALDDYTIEITLAEPCDYYIQLMTMFVFFPVRSDYAPELDYTWAAELHPTNGAYTYESIDNATEIVMVKNEYYTYADDVTTQKLVAVVMEDSDAQLMAFQTGEIDFAGAVDTATAYALYEGSDELVLSSTIVNYYMHINCYGDNEALSDYNVRRAIQLGIDRTNIVTALAAGDVYYEIYGFVPVGFTGIDGDFREEQDESDPLVYTDKDEARALMEASGYSETNRLTLTYSTNSLAMHDTVAAVIVEELAEIYIDVVIDNKELRAFSEERSAGLTEIARGSMSADYLDVTTYLDMALLTNQDVQTWGDETYDAMVAAANALTGDERLQALHDAEEYLVRTMAYVVPLFGYYDVALAVSGIEGVYSTYQGVFMFNYVKVPA